MQNTTIHEKYMLRALELAAKGEATVSPNPMVGAVIVKGGRVIAEGWHARAGEDHAEIVAIKNAQESVKGATLYVTLEPCHHWGRTPPCVDAVIQFGFKDVVIAVADPNPLTSGKSIHKLRGAGINVTVGVCEEQARELNRVFFKYMEQELPFVTAKIAQTLDGKIAAANGSSQWITSDETRKFSKSQRKNFDAILVGVNTVLKDNPVLNAPGRTISFKKVIVDSSLRMSLKANVFEDGKCFKDVIIATTKKASARKIKTFEAKGVHLMICPSKSGRVDLGYLFKKLAEQKVTSVLIEGGATVIGSALKDRLVDRLHIYIAPKIVGDQNALSSVIGLKTRDINQSLQLEFRGVRNIGEDLFMEASVS